MNGVLIHAIVESLRVSGPGEESLARFGAFTERDWKETLPWLDESGLGLYLLNRLSETDKLPALPTSIQARLQEDLEANCRRVAAMREEFRSLLRALTAGGVDFLVLKGFALVPDFCPDATLRTQYDYDFLVHPNSESAAHLALQAQGYSRKDQNPGFQKDTESLYTAEPLSAAQDDSGFYSINIPRAVELHGSLWESNREMISLDMPTSALDCKRPSNWRGLRFPVLAEHDALILQSSHAFQHILNYWCRPSCFLEIAHFLEKRRFDAAFWEQLRLRVEAHKHLPQVMGLVFSMAELLFKAPLPPEAADWTTATLPHMLSSWVERHGRGWALTRFPGSKLSLLVHREFIDDPKAWKQVERTRLFPFHRPARIAEAGEQGLGARWRARCEQSRFVGSRAIFHLRGLLEYTSAVVSQIRAAKSAGFLRFTTYGYSLGYLLLAAVCLIRWHTNNPWVRFDLFSGGYLLLRTVGSVHSVAASRNVFRSRQVREEWWATNSDPGGIQRVMVLMGLDLTVLVAFANGHWGLFEWPVLRGFGLALYVGAIAWQIWTDGHLAKFFATGPQEAPPMSEGPYRFVRHPRYSSALAGKVAFALIFANPLGWLMVLAWGRLLIRKVEVEEAHLMKVFGGRYEAYQMATAKLLPGIY